MFQGVVSWEKMESLQKKQISLFPQEKHLRLLLKLKVMGQQEVNRQM